MAVEIRVPRLGWTMEQGVFVAWLKKDGDTVRPGEPLFTLEGDKAVQDVEATDAGVLRIAADGPKEGETVAVGTLLGHLAATREALPSSPSPWMGEGRGGGAAAPSPHPSPPPQQGEGAREPAHDPERIAISPRARRLAGKIGIDVTLLQGTGRTGRIRERDVRAAAKAHREVIDGERRPATPARRAIAARMLASLRSTAPVTLTTTADAENLVSLRQQFRAAPRLSEGVTPTYTDLIVKLAAIALQAHPALNARWEDGDIVVLSHVHIGIAVDTEAGLLVPVIRDVPALGLRQLAARSRELLERARTRKLSAAEMQGSTFTVSNLGAYGIDAFTPIINHPECAILGVGRIRRAAAVVGEQVVARYQLTLSLTFDHRIVDGGPAARFLDTLRQSVENPGPWLIA